MSRTQPRVKKSRFGEKLVSPQYTSLQNPIGNVSQFDLQASGGKAGYTQQGPSLSHPTRTPSPGSSSSSSPITPELYDRRSFTNPFAPSAAPLIQSSFSGLMGDPSPWRHAVSQPEPTPHPSSMQTGQLHRMTTDTEQGSRSSPSDSSSGSSGSPTWTSFNALSLRDINRTYFQIGNGQPTQSTQKHLQSTIPSPSLSGNDMRVSTPMEDSSSTSAPLESKANSVAASSAWLQRIPEMIERLDFYIQAETPETLARYYRHVSGRDSGTERSSVPRRRAVFSDLSHVPPELELMIVDSFIEDVYDGALHCLTIREMKLAEGAKEAQGGDDNGRQPSMKTMGKHHTDEAIGIVFWRDVPDDEMQGWIDKEFARLIVPPKRSRIIKPPTETLPPGQVSTKVVKSRGIMAPRRIVRARRALKSLPAMPQMQVPLSSAVPQGINLGGGPVDDSPFLAQLLKDADSTEQMPENTQSMNELTTSISGLRLQSRATLSTGSKAPGSHKSRSHSLPGALVLSPTASSGPLQPSTPPFAPLGATGKGASGVNRSEDAEESETAVREVYDFPTSRTRIAARNWIKIEFLSVAPAHRRQGLATLLLGACFVAAAKHYGREKSVLHVAGGVKNMPAMRLYEKFGFKQAPYDAFHVPNRDLMVVLDIRKSLYSLPWDRIIAELAHSRHRRLKGNAGQLTDSTRNRSDDPTDITDLPSSSMLDITAKRMDDSVGLSERMSTFFSPTSPPDDR